MNKNLSLVFVLIFAFTLILSACSGNNATTAPAQEPTSQSTEPVLTGTEAPVATDQTSAGTPDAEALAAGEKLVQERCSVCHSLSRVESKSASYDQWEQTVNRMIANGAQLNEDEKQLVIDYLAATYPE
mgnify:CR=1 FL=1